MTDLAESRFTPVSQWCPHPERWHSPDDLATETEVSELVGALVRATQPDFVVETGAYLGHTTVCIGRALLANGHGRCDAIEMDQSRARRVGDAVQGLPVNVIRGNSIRYTPPEPVGFAFLDSEIHLRPIEVHRLWPHFADGAVVVVHDSAPHHMIGRGEWLARTVHGMQALNLRTPRGVLIFQVTR